jgi:hypothetical protein
MRIHVFNVGHGNCILLELPSESGHARVGVFDCYSGRGLGESPLLAALKTIEQSGRKLEISFLCLSHLHIDHILGVGQIIERYGSSVMRLIDPGIDPRVVAAAEFPTNTMVDGEARRDLESIQRFKKEYAARVLSATSPRTVLFEDSASGVRVETVAPEGVMLLKVQRTLARWFGSLRSANKNADRPIRLNEPPRTFNLNHTSSALLVSTARHRVLLGGDVLAGAWRRLAPGFSPEVDALVLSHHGSHSGFSRDGFHYLLKTGGIGVVSGDGRYPTGSMRRCLDAHPVTLYGTGQRPSDRSTEVLRTWVLDQHYRRRLSAVDARSGDVIMNLAGETLDVLGRLAS